MGAEQRLPRKVRRKKESKRKSARLTLKQLDTSLRHKTETLDRKLEEIRESVRALSERSLAQTKELEERMLKTLAQTKQEVSNAQENVRQLKEAEKQFVEEQTLDRLLAGIRDESGRAVNQSRQEVANLSKGVDGGAARIAEVEATLAQIKGELDGRITSVASELQMMQAKVGDLEPVKGAVDQLKQGLSSFKDQLEALSLRQPEIETEIRRLKNELGQKTASYETRLDSMEPALNVTRSSVESLRESLDEFKARSESAIQELRQLVESKTKKLEEDTLRTATE